MKETTVGISQPLCSTQFKRHSYILFYMLISLLTGCLASCGSLPRPFEGGDKDNAIVQSILINPSVMIAPVIGAPPPVNLQLAEQVAAAAQKRDVAAVTRGASRKASLLQGIASTYKNESRDTFIRINWELVGPNGIVIDRTSTETEAFEPTADDPWLLFANSNLDAIVDRTAEFLATAVFRPKAENDEGALSVSTTELGFDSPYHLFIKPVEGAPGDGSKSLADAMNELLGVEGIPIPLVVASFPSDISFVIAGRVTLTPVDNAADAVSLVWDLMLPSGQVLGSVNQENIIPRGSLDGEWGEIAFEAAAAAADGLMSVLLQMDPLEAQTDDQIQP